MSVPAQNATGATVALTDAPQLAIILERYLRDPSIDPHKLEKLVELQERIMRWSAETAFNAAMAEAQSEIVRVVPNAVNPQTRSRYASLPALDAAIKPIYIKYGFALSYGTDDCPIADTIRVVCDVSKGGHIKRYHIDMPVDGKGAKGRDVMSRTHATASGISYGRRYLLGMIFNVTVGIDDDGNSAGSKTARAQIEDIKNLPEDERDAASEQMHEDYSQREADRMRTAMREDDIEIWDDTQMTTKNQFLLATREFIRTARDPSALVSWWNSSCQKQMRDDFELTRNESSSLKDFVIARRNAMKTELREKEARER